MRAVAIDAFGDVPKIHDLPKPEGARRVRVVAAGVNPVDGLIARGDFIPFAIRFPFTLGLDFAGIDDATGDRLYGRAIGTYAEYVAVPPNGTVATIPESLDFAQAAAVPSAAMTALTSVEAAGIGERSRVLIVGATGGVGSFAVQFAKQRKAHVVATASDADAAYVRQLGADEIVDYTRNDARFPDGLDVLLDFASDAPGLRSMSRLVREGGTALSTRYVADIENLAARRIRGINIVNEPTTSLLEEISDAFGRGTLRPPDVRTFPLDRAADALAKFETGHVRGKLVLLV